MPTTKDVTKIMKKQVKLFQEDEATVLPELDLKEAENHKPI